LAESPVVKLARLLGGVVLMQGRLGHQVLGQLLVMDTNEVAVAGAAVVVAATARQQNTVAQVAIRTAAPALAVRALLQKQERRVDRQMALLAERERKIEKRDQAVGQREREMEIRRSMLDAVGQPAVPPAAIRITAIEGENRELQRRVKRLARRLRFCESRR
jgi:hypothetical protein